MLRDRFNGRVAFVGIRSNESAARAAEEVAGALPVGGKPFEALEDAANGAAARSFAARPPRAMPPAPTTAPAVAVLDEDEPFIEDATLPSNDCPDAPLAVDDWKLNCSWLTVEWDRVSGWRPEAAPAIAFGAIVAAAATAGTAAPRPASPVEPLTVAATPLRDAPADEETGTTTVFVRRLEW